MSYNDDIQFVIGALAHGMPFETAFQMVEQAKDERAQARASKRQALGDIINAGVGFAMQEDADPNQVLGAVSALGAGAGLKPKQQAQVYSALGMTGDPTAPLEGVLGTLGEQAAGFTEEDAGAFAMTEGEGGAPTPAARIGVLAKNPAFMRADGTPDRAKIRAQIRREFLTPQDLQDPNYLPGFDQALNVEIDRLMSGMADVNPEGYKAYQERLAMGQMSPEQAAEFKASGAGAPPPESGAFGGMGTPGENPYGWGLGAALGQEGVRGLAMGAQKAFPGVAGESPLMSKLAGMRTPRTTLMKYAGDPIKSRVAGQLPGTIAKSGLIRGVGAGSGVGLGGSATGGGAAGFLAPLSGLSGAASVYGLGSLYNEMEGTTDTGGMPLLGGLSDRLTPETSIGSALQGTSGGLAPLMAQGANNVDRYVLDPLKRFFF